MSWVTAKWIVDKIKETWTPTRAGYLDLLNNSTYGLNAIKNVSDKERDWYATYSESSIALKSLSSPINVTDRDADKTLFSFYAPANGVYIMQVTYDFTNVSQANPQNYWFNMTVGVGDYSVMIMSDDTATSWKVENNKSHETYPEIGATKTYTRSHSVFLEKGRRYKLYVKSGSTGIGSTVSLKITSAKVTYAKTYVNT